MEREDIVSAVVWVASPIDVGHGRIATGLVGVPDCKGVELTDGDYAIIHGSGRMTSARVKRAYRYDHMKGVIRIDGIIRKNAQAPIGSIVRLEFRKKDEMTEIEFIALAPFHTDQSSKRGFSRIKVETSLGDTASVQLLDRSVTVGDRIFIPGVTWLGVVLPFEVTRIEPPCDCGILCENTEYAISEQLVGATNLSE